MAPVAAFSTLGSNAKDLLYGTAKAGRYQFDKVLNVSSTTVDGVEFTMGAVGKDDKLEMSLKAAYSAAKSSYVASLAQSGKLGVSATYKELAPGLTVGFSGTVPDVDSGKVAIDYSVPHVTLKSSATLTAAPKVDVAVSTGAEGVVLGGEASYDTSKAALTKWVLGLGYTASDYQAALLLNDQNKATALLSHKVTADTTIGAEVTRDLNTNATTFSTGLSKRLEGGATTKVKLDNAGLVSVLYEQELKGRTRMAVSSQFNALDLNAKPKFGFGYDIRY